MVSVIIPTWNRGKYIEGAVRSVDRQESYKKEVVIVDDGSDDDTNSVVDRLSKECSVRVKYHYQNNKGAPAARNKGLEISEGEKVIFLDSDDRLLDGVIRHANKESREGKVIFGNVRYVNRNSKCIGVKDHKKDVSCEEFLLKYNIPTSSSIYWKEDVIQVGGFDESINRGQEKDLNYRLCIDGVRFESVNEYFSENIVGLKNSISHIVRKKENAMWMVQNLRNKEKFFRKVRGRVDVETEYIATDYWKLGRKLSKIGAKNEAQTCFQRAKEISGDNAIDGKYLYKIVSKIVNPYYIDRIKNFVGKG